MYIPPYNVVLDSIGSTREELKDAAQVTIPMSLFKFLTQLAVTNGDFNEAGYLKANPDVAEAVKVGKIESARLHYIYIGYFESRQGATPDVDEHWYLKCNPDVDAAVKAGKLSSASEHFAVAGAGEWRCPSPHYEGDLAQWRAALEVP